LNSIGAREIALFLTVAILLAASAVSLTTVGRVGVASLGKYGDSETFFNNVKLEEGSNISIAPSNAHNSLIISSTSIGSLIEFRISGALSTGTNVSFEIPSPFTLNLSELYARVKTAPSGSSIILEVRVNAT